MRTVRRDQARQTDVEVAAEHRGMPLLPSLDDGGDDAERIAPEKDELAFREETDDLVHDQAVRRRLVDEVARLRAGGLLVETQDEVAQLGLVALPRFWQLLAEVLDRGDHEPVLVLRDDSLRTQGVEVWQQNPGLRHGRLAVVGGDHPLQKGRAAARYGKDEDRLYCPTS